MGSFFAGKAHEERGKLFVGRTLEDGGNLFVDKAHEDRGTLFVGRTLEDGGNLFVGKAHEDVLRKDARSDAVHSSPRERSVGSPVY